MAELFCATDNSHARRAGAYFGDSKLTPLEKIGHVERQAHWSVAIVIPLAFLLMGVVLGVYLAEWASNAGDS